MLPAKAVTAATKTNATSTSANRKEQDTTTIAKNYFDADDTSSTKKTEKEQMLQTKVQLSVKNKCNVNTLHHAMGPFLVLSRFFGILPVMGIWPTDDVEQVYFKWFTLPVLITFVLLGFALLDVFLTFKVMAEQGLKLTTTGPFSFSIECLSAFIVFLLLSRNWPNLIRATQRLENIFSQYLYASKESRHFSQRIQLLGFIFLVGSAIEHSFYVGSGIYSSHLQIKQCNLTVDFWRNYYIRERLQIFSLVEYTPWLIPLLQWITISMTFAWNFIDIFLMLICEGLAMRFRQFHWCIQCHLKKNTSNNFWSKVRLDFLTLADLLWQYDDKLSNLVLLSSAQNLYFLAVQIFHSFQYRDNFMNNLYFWFSLGFVAFRTFYMMLAAASINDVAGEILSSMYEIPTSNWCLELKRLNEVIVSDLFALSGKGFYYLTKRLMLAMAGTLVVYELVLLDQVDGADVSTPLCRQRKG